MELPACNNLHDFAFYVFLLVAIVVSIVVLKKIAGCLLRSVVIIAVVALLAYVYFHCFAATN